MKTIARYLSAALVAVLAAACGNGPDMIDRTQPNYVRKSELTQGSWYVMDTVVEVPPTTALSFVGQQGQMDKVRFEITEDMLIAYRTYELVPGTDPNVDSGKSRIGNTVTLDGKPYRGAPYGAWRVISHFDRQRDYNAATGEQANTLGENTTDRPWYQREFMRVAWDRNLITNLTLADPSIGAPGNATYTVTAIDQEVGDDAFTTAYTTRGDKQQLSYFDFTIKQGWEPQKTEYPGYGQIPYCWLNPRVDCEGAIIKSRYSFKRVDDARVKDYEPLFYTDKHMTKFGYFRTERITYDRNRGVTDSGRLLFADRHNIYKRWRDDSGKSIEVAKREPVPVVYYLSAGFPAELMDGARDLEKSWNNAFRRAIAVPRGLQTSDPQLPDMFVLCENPVKAGAPAACGAEGTSPRLGDIRYNIMAWVHDPQLAGPLGYGPHGADPETGEIVQAGAYMFGAALDTWVGDATVINDVLTGDTSIDELTSGKNVRDFIAKNYQPGDPRRPSTGPWTSQNPLTAADALQNKSDFGAMSRLAPQFRGQVDSYVRQGHPPLEKEDRRKVVDTLIANNPALEAELVDATEVRAAVLANAPGEKYRQKLLSDPSFYRSVARQTMLRAGDIDKLEKARIDRASKANIWMAEFSDDQFYGLAKRMKGLYDQHFNKYKIEGKSDTDAKTLAKKDVFNKMRNSGFRSVAEHEVGHTLGLMHNFQGSYDALNYGDDYWRMRKDSIGIMNGTIRQFPTQPQELVDAARPNQAQIDGSMDEYAYSSIMDYGSRMNADIHGIGKYDNAAILFAYSGSSTPGYVEVFEQTRADKDGPAAYEIPQTEWPTSWMRTDPNSTKVPPAVVEYKLPVRGAHAEIPYRIARHYTPVSQMLTDKYHYTTLPFMFADADVGGSPIDFTTAIEQGVTRMKQRSFVPYSTMEPIYQAIESSYRDYVARNKDRVCNGNTCDDPDDIAETAVILKPVLTANGNRIPVEVPYMFCSDYEVGSALSCNRWDRGADYYEMTEDWISRYKDYYVFANFKRDRYGFSPNSVFSRIYGRLLSNFPNVYQHWLFNVYWYADYYANARGPAYDQAWLHAQGFPDPLVQNYWTMAVMDSTNLLLQNMTTPAAGYYGRTPDASATALGHWERVTLPGNSRDVRLSAEAEAQFRQEKTGGGVNGGYADVVYVPRGPARSMYTQFEHDGYDFFRRPVEVGHFWDQYASMITLSASRTNFLGVDRGSDALRYSLPYYSTFPKELSRTYGGLWTESFDKVGGIINLTGGGLANYTPATLVKGADYIVGFNYPVNNVSPTATNDRVVYPSPTWSTKFYTNLYGMAFFTEVFNQDYAAQNQVFKLGTGENITPTADFTAVTFQDPYGGGYTYAALKPNATTATLSSAVVMVEKAKAYDVIIKSTTATAAEKAKADAGLRETVRSLELMRGLYAIFSQTW